jgi:hypothetical protein
MNYKGVIIKESLKDLNILNDVKIIKSETEKVTPKHRTPWLQEWTSLTIEIEEEKIDGFLEKLKNSLDNSHEWYVDLSNNKYDITIFNDQIIKKRVYRYFKE